MSDFHKSLDAAIQRLEGRLDKLPEGYEDAGYLLEDSEGPTLKGHRAELYVLDEAQVWRDVSTAFPARFACGLDQVEEDFNFSVLWQMPEPATLEIRNISLEAMELLFGGALIPLCLRQIPERGTE